MPEKVLYYLGAGASAQALPLVKTNSNYPQAMASLPTAMRTMAMRIKEAPASFTANENQEKFIATFADELIWLGNESEKHATTDTYAKFLFLTDRNKYDRLKFVLSLFFTIQQLHDKRLDPRYLTWLVSIMNKQLFPENVKVISWNYDFQMQLTAEIFRKESFNYGSGVAKHSPALIEYYPSVGHNFIDPEKDFSLLHLNGIAGFYKNDAVDEHAFLNSHLYTQGNYLDNFISNNGYSRLYFAWEKEHEKMTKAIIAQMVKDVTIMVVIGYSFPFFNREMDMEVYKVLQQSNKKLKKIYFQDPVRDGSFMRGQFGYNPDFPIEHIKDTDSFYVPFEL